MVGEPSANGGPALRPCVLSLLHENIIAARAKAYPSSELRRGRTKAGCPATEAEHVGASAGLRATSGAPLPEPPLKPAEAPRMLNVAYRTVFDLVGLEWIEYLGRGKRPIRRITPESVRRMLTTRREFFEKYGRTVGGPPRTRGR